MVMDGWLAPAETAIGAAATGSCVHAHWHAGAQAHRRWRDQELVACPREPKACLRLPRFWHLHDVTADLTLLSGCLADALFGCVSWLAARGVCAQNGLSDRYMDDKYGFPADVYPSTAQVCSPSSARGALQARRVCVAGGIPSCACVCACGGLEGQRRSCASIAACARTGA